MENSFIFDNIDIEKVTPEDINKLLKRILIKDSEKLRTDNSLKAEEKNIQWTLLCIQMENLVHYIEKSQSYFDSYKQKMEGAHEG